MSYERGELRCDMKSDCSHPITNIDKKGYVYCANHGLQRRQTQPCRKLTASELKRLVRGETLIRY